MNRVAGSTALFTENSTPSDQCGSPDHDVINAFRTFCGSAEADPLESGLIDTEVLNGMIQSRDLKLFLSLSLIFVFFQIAYIFISNIYNFKKKNLYFLNQGFPTFSAQRPPSVMTVCLMPPSPTLVPKYQCFYPLPMDV